MTPPARSWRHQSPVASTSPQPSGVRTVAAAAAAALAAANGPTATQPAHVPSASYTGPTGLVEEAELAVGKQQRILSWQGAQGARRGAGSVSQSPLPRAPSASHGMSPTRRSGPASVTYSSWGGGGGSAALSHAAPAPVPLGKRGSVEVDLPQRQRQCSRQTSFRMAWDVPASKSPIRQQSSYSATRGGSPGGGSFNCARGSATVTCCGNGTPCGRAGAAGQPEKQQRQQKQPQQQQQRARQLQQGLQPQSQQRTRLPTPRFEESSLSPQPTHKQTPAPSLEPMSGATMKMPAAVKTLASEELEHKVFVSAPFESPDNLDASEYSYPSADLEGLVAYFEDLERSHARLTEVTYIVNVWSLGKIIPLQHHGFVVKAEGRGWLTLDFSRRGILWDTFDEYPDFPEGTIYAKQYPVDVDPGVLKTYCKETQPFSWHSNDCRQWAKGVMEVMQIDEEPLTDPDAFRQPECRTVRAPHCGFRGMKGGWAHPAVISCLA